MTKREDLLGRWRRVAGGAPYPTALTFAANGVYEAERGPGGYAIWDVGTFRLEGDDTIVMSTANDAEVAYDLRCADGELTFRDLEGRVLRYRR